MLCCLPLSLHDKLPLIADMSLQEEKRKTEAAAAAAAEAAKQAAGGSEGGSSSGNKGGKKKGSSRPPDPDPDGAKLAATADPLGEATKFVVMLKQVRRTELCTPDAALSCTLHSSSCNLHVCVACASCCCTVLVLYLYCTCLNTEVHLTCLALYVFTALFLT